MRIATRQLCKLIALISLNDLRKTTANKDVAINMYVSARDIDAAFVEHDIIRYSTSNRDTNALRFPFYNPRNESDNGRLIFAQSSRVIRSTRPYPTTAAWKLALYNRDEQLSYIPCIIPGLRNQRIHVSFCSGTLRVLSRRIVDPRSRISREIALLSPFYYYASGNDLKKSLLHLTRYCNFNQDTKSKLRLLNIKMLQ